LQEGRTVEDRAEMAGFKFEEMKDWNSSLQECFALVGEFLWHFSLLESELDDLLARMMGLETMNALILAANIDLAKKINLAICGIEYQPVDRAEAVKDLKKVFSINDDRKIVAHCFFGPSKKRDGIEFRRTTANSKLKLMSVVWTMDEMQAKFADIRATRDCIKALTAAISPDKSAESKSLWIGQGLKIGILGSD
jgi:hypothetical protein